MGYYVDVHYGAVSNDIETYNLVIIGAPGSNYEGLQVLEQMLKPM